MHAFVKDVRHGIKLMRKNPGVAAIVVLSIALGVSVNATVYSCLESMVLNPLPSAPDGNRLVAFAAKTRSGEYIPSSYPDYRDYKEQTKSLTGPAAFRELPFSLGHGERTERVWAMTVTGNFFEVLGIKQALGRFFLPEDNVDTPAAHSVVVISHDFWESHHDAQSSAVGQTLALNGQVFTIVGVAPRGFNGTVVGLSFDVWVPLLLQNRLTGGDSGWINDRRHRALHAIARLGPGVALEDAQAELNVISTRLAETYPETNEGISAVALPLSRTPWGAQGLLGPILSLLLFASFAVLMIVAANLASLLLARAASRERETGIRMALGAGKRRLLRQFMTENLAFSLVAAMLSPVFVLGLSGLLGQLIPATNLPVSLTLRLSPAVFFLCVLLSILTGLAAGLAAAWRSVTIEVSVALNEAGRGTSASHRNRRLQAALVVSQVALALVALIGAGMFVKSLRYVTQIDPGFDNKQVLLVALTTSSPDQEFDEMKAYYRRIKERLQTLPTVRAVSYAEHVPVGLEAGSWEKIEVNEYMPSRDESMQIYRNFVEDDYFDVMRIPRVDGRFFRQQDDEDSPAVAIVNETFVRRFLEKTVAVGRQLRGWGRTLTIVGVVKDSKYESVTEAPRPYLFVPFRQFAAAGRDVIVHVAVDGVPPEIALATVRKEIDSSGSLAYVSYAMPLKEYTGAGLFQHRVAATLLTVLGTAALVLATLGVYGVMSHSVAQRTSEIGVRMALGATGGNILGLFVSQGLRLSLTGSFVGVLASVALSRFWATLVYGVDALDSITVLGVSFVVVAVALLASVVPAHRASKVDPVRALPPA